MGEDEESTDEPAEGANEQAESAESEPEQQAPEGGDEGGSDGDQPEIAEEEQATIPENIEVSGEDIEEETSDDEDTDEDSGDEKDASSGGESEQTEADAMGSDGSGSSPVKAGELYVTVVQQATNAAIRSRDETAEEVDRDHFEEYDLAHYFDETMEEMGVGSDLEPHEALVLATALAAGEPILTRTDVMDEQIGRLMDKAMNGGAAA